MLTAVSTVLGLIPIAPTVFWGPMAFAIMGGLLVATVLTLIFLPALYVAWFRIKEPAAYRDDRHARAGRLATDVAGSLMLSRARGRARRASDSSSSG